MVSPASTVEQTIVWAIETYGRNAIASVNVDLCATAARGTDTLAEVVSACERLKCKCAVFFTFMRADRTGELHGQDPIAYITDGVGINRDWLEREGLIFNYHSYSAKGGGSHMCVIGF